MSPETDMPKGAEAQRGLLRRMFKPEEGGELKEDDFIAAQRELFGDRARAAGIPENPPSAVPERTLSPEQIEVLVGTLRDRFSRNKELHQGIVWADVEKALRASPESLWSLQQLEATGGEPDVLRDEGDAFRFGDFSKESPLGRRNVVFDAEAEAYLQKHYPRESCNGNAADRVAKWRVDFMSENEFYLLQRLVKVDANTRGWVRTSVNIRSIGGALGGYRFGEDVGVLLCDAYGHHDSMGFRCSLSVKKV